MNIITGKLLYTTLLITCLLVGCSPGSNAISTSSPATTLPPLPSPTSQVVEFTPTTSIATLEDQKLKDIVLSPCLTISSEPPGGNQIPWLLLALRGIIPYAIDPNTGMMTDQLLPDPDPNSNSPFASDFSLSPDGKWLAYNLYGETEVSLVVEPSSNILTSNSEGRIIWQPSQPARLEDWLSNENVMLVKNQSLENFGSTLIYNPFTGEQHEFLLEEMPNSLNQQYGMSGSYLMDRGNLIPDPSLMTVIYPLALEAEGFHVALWDVGNKKVLARLKYTLSQLSRDPLWSQDGSDFLIVGLTAQESTEWFQVTRNGAIHQLTHVSEFLEDAEFNLPSRSWDGRNLVFQLIYSSRKESKYLFIDLTSQPLDGFCLSLGGEDSGSLHPPVWSPDNRYVVITNGVYSGHSTDVILVDVETREAFQIGKDVEAIGWIVKP